MARGWESKAVEDQINQAEARKEAKQRQALTESEIQQRKARDGLLLERTRILRELESSRNERYRALMRRTLEHVESRLEEMASLSE